MYVFKCFFVPLDSVKRKKWFFLQVEDVNDNAPEFVNLPYYAAVQVEAEPGSAIFRVSAVDRDYGQNGEVTYSLKKQHRNFQVISRIMCFSMFSIYVRRSRVGY